MRWLTSPQTEKGFTRIANELLEAIQMYKFSLNEMKIIMCVWRFTYGFNRKSHALSLSFFENHTGLSRTRLNTSLKNLVESNVIEKIDVGDAKRTNSYKFNKHYNAWKIEKYAVFNSVQNDTNDSVQNVTDTSVQDVTINSVQNDTSTSVQNVTDTSVQIDTQERKVKEILKKDIKTEERKAAEIGNPFVYNSFENQTEGESENMTEKYLRPLLNRFVELRGYGFDPKPADLETAKEIQAKGIPLQTAIDGMTEVFSEYQPKHSHDKIHTLSYCTGRIMDKHFGKGSKKPGEKSLFDASPETLERQQREAEKYKDVVIDYGDLPY